MYIRFITTYRDERGYAETGVFHALGHLAYSESTFEYDRENIKRIRLWFGEYLDRPTRFNKHSGNRHTAPAQNIYTRVFLLLLFATILPIAGYAQSHEIRFGIQKGANKILIGDGFHETKVGHCTALKIDLVLHGKNSKFSFEPSLYTVKHFYYSRIEENLSVKNAQRSLGLMLMTGMSLRENITFKFGLFAQAVVSGSIEVVSKNGTATTSFGSTALYETYVQRSFQAGVVGSMGLAIGEKKRWGIELGIQQFATSFLEKDYLLNFSTTAAGNTVVFTGKSLPVVLTAGVYIRIF